MIENWRRPFDPDVDMSAPMDMDVPIDSLSTGNAKGKKKASGFDGVDDSKPSKSRTLGGDRPRESVVVREIGSGTTAAGLWEGPHVVAGALSVPPLYNSLIVRVEGSDDTLEGRNSESDGECSLLFWFMRGAEYSLFRSD
jgi:protein HIRA/HIR1